MDGPKTVADPNTGTIYEASSNILGPLSSGDPKRPKAFASAGWFPRKMG